MIAQVRTLAEVEQACNGEVSATGNSWIVLVYR